MSDCYLKLKSAQNIRRGKVDLQFIITTFSKKHAGGRSFFIISFATV